MSLLNEALLQKEYLKKYLSGEDVKKKKKKKISANKIKRSQIIDDDIDLKSMRPLDDDEVELYQMNEDAPQIAGIIDERPLEVKAQEQYNSKRWKVFGGEDGVNVVDNMEKEQKSVSDKLSAMSKELGEDDSSQTRENLTKSSEVFREDTDSKQTKSKKAKLIKKKNSDFSDSDLSPDRVGKNVKSSSRQHSDFKKKSADSDSDVSLPRPKKHIPSRHYDSDLSPPRNNQKGSDRHEYDSDASPQRKSQSKNQIDRYRDSDPSPPRRGSTKESVRRSDKSSPRRDVKRNSHRSGSDNSPPRRDKRKNSRYKNDSDNSPQRKANRNHHNYKTGSDYGSPPRIREKDERLMNKYNIDKPPPRRGGRQSSSESDSSPPRRERKRSPEPRRKSPRRERKRSPRSNTPPIKRFSTKESLPRLKISNNVSPRLSRRDLANQKNTKRRFSDSDDSPPRKRSFCHDGSVSDLTPPRKKPPIKKEKSLKKSLYKPNDSTSSDEKISKSKKMKITLDGKMAGLQDAKQLKKELSDLRMKEDLMFSKMEASVSGVGAAAIKRDRKTGQVRDLEKEKEAQKEKDAKASVVNEKYYKWGKGIKQVEDAAERAAEAMKEMNKPLARYVDDTDLDNFLKAQDRDGDPMLDYVKRKQSEATPLMGEKPVYKGACNPNRFNIRPGHRWDGVVRSNGYEKEWFTHQNARKARTEEAYKWSTSDM